MPVGLSFVRPPAGRGHFQWIAESVRQDEDFGTEVIFASPDRLILVGFFRDGAVPLGGYDGAVGSSHIHCRPTRVAPGMPLR
jgi:hypothetical protein